MPISALSLTIHSSRTYVVRPNLLLLWVLSPLVLSIPRKEIRTAWEKELNSRENLAEGN